MDAPAQADSPAAVLVRTETAVWAGAQEKRAMGRGCLLQGCPGTCPLPGSRGCPGEAPGHGGVRRAAWPSTGRSCSLWSSRWRKPRCPLCFRGHGWVHLDRLCHRQGCCPTPRSDFRSCSPVASLDIAPHPTPPSRPPPAPPGPALGKGAACGSVQGPRSRARRHKQLSEQALRQPLSCRHDRNARPGGAPWPAWAVSSGSRDHQPRCRCSQTTPRGSPGGAAPGSW